MELCNASPSEISSKEKLFASQFSVIFLVTVRNQTCVMKVHHGRGPPRYYEPQDRELDIHVLESTAYRRLKERGLCDQGFVPNFLGVMRKFHPALCSPPHHLEKFIDDEYLPSAIFLEYIPNLEMIIPENFTEKRMDGFIEGIHQIYKAFVLHNDPKPRNMMVVRGDPAERVVWLDFDRAETYDEDAITDEQVQWISEEEETIVVFKELLKIDHSKGKLEEAYRLYCN